jgi:hypothetical protein
MNKKAILFAALLGAALLALTGCENMAHDLHKKGGGAAKTKPGGPEVPGSGSAAIQLSVTGDFALETPYNYDVSAVGFEHPDLTISNTGTADSDPLTVTLTGTGAERFTVSPATIAGIAAGQSATCTITPKPGLVPGPYTVDSVQVDVGSDQLSELLNKKFTVVFNAVIDLSTPGNSVGTGTDFTYNGTDLFTIPYNTAVQVTGTSTNVNRIEVNGADFDHHTYIELDGAHITANAAGSALKMKDYAKVTLYLKATTTNELKTVESNSAGLTAPVTTKLVIMGGGTLEAQGGNNGAGIGGGLNGAGGVITIEGGTVTASSDGGAGIGGGQDGAGGDITITDGMVTATSSHGAGIGGGNSRAGGDIIISGGTITAMGNYGAGIGGGAGADGDEITISGGMVIATSNYGAGIGGAGNPASGGDGGDGGDITITGGTVIALGNDWGAAIGGGGSGTYANLGGAGGNITITGGTVYARSTSSPAHIGYGHGYYSDGADAIFTYTGGSVKPVIFAGTISEGSPFYAGSDGIAGVGDVTVAMTTVPVIVSGINVTMVDTVTVTLQPGRSFTVPANATLTVPPIAELNLNGQALTNNGTIIVQSGGTLSGTPAGPGAVIRE